MSPTLDRLVFGAPRLVAVMATTWLLVASSPPPDEPRCGRLTAPVPFRVTGTCGPNGIIVVNASRLRGDIWIDNAALLGLRPVEPVGDDSDDLYNFAGVPRGHGLYTGTACPFDLVAGAWEIYGRQADRMAMAAGARPMVVAGDGGIADGGGDALVLVDAQAAPPRTDALPQWVSGEIDRLDICQALSVGGVLTLRCSNHGVATCESTLTPVP